VSKTKKIFFLQEASDHSRRAPEKRKKSEKQGRFSANREKGATSGAGRAMIERPAPLSAPGDEGSGSAGGVWRRLALYLWGAQKT